MIIHYGEARLEGRLIVYRLGSDSKESAFNTGNSGSVPVLGRCPGEENGYSFLPGEFHQQRSLVGYSPWGHKELDMTEQITLSLSFTVVTQKRKYQISVIMAEMARSDSRYIFIQHS